MRCQIPFSISEQSFSCLLTIYLHRSPIITISKKKYSHGMSARQQRYNTIALVLKVRTFAYFISGSDPVLNLSRTDKGIFPAFPYLSINSW